PAPSGSPTEPATSSNSPSSESPSNTRNVYASPKFGYATRSGRSTKPVSEIDSSSPYRTTLWYPLRVGSPEATTGWFQRETVLSPGRYDRSSSKAPHREPSASATETSWLQRCSRPACTWSVREVGRSTYGSNHPPLAFPSGEIQLRVSPMDAGRV